jgi:hypothetical protein
MADTTRDISDPLWDPVEDEDLGWEDDDEYGEEE